MFRIEKMPSGFYALTWASDGKIVRADLVPWDGKRGTSYEYDTSGETDYYIDAENTVYYAVNGGGTGTWCNGNRLNAHCRYLQQIKARR